MSGRDELFILVLIGLMAPPGMDRIPASIASIFTAMAPYTSGRTFVNLHCAPCDEANRARAWSDETYAQLVRAKSICAPHTQPAAVPARRRTGETVPG